MYVLNLFCHLLHLMTLGLKKAGWTEDKKQHRDFRRFFAGV